MPEPVDDLGQLIHTPAYEHAIAGGEAIARLLGHRALLPEHVVLAVLLDPDSLPSQVLDEADRQRLVSDLRAVMEDADYTHDPSEPPPDGDAFRSGPVH
ncbi:Clp protease N-terminal domain-containing protein [Streptomyces venezuelae]|uniref:Clp protease N-terminal domain-containing protein n=1 Tax=Streptomyces venezuelae TaxID=54571 RepID=UPI0034333B88